MPTNDQPPDGRGGAPRDTHVRLLRAQRVARMGFIDWNLATNEAVLSDEVYRLLGLDRQTGPTMNVHLVEMVHPDDRTRVGEALERAARGEADYDLDHRMIRADGGVIWVHAQAVLSRDPAGQPETLLGTIVDITARKVAELALRESESRLRLALEVTQIGIWDWDLRVDDWSANGTYFHMLGYDRSVHAAHRQFWSERVHPDDRQWVVETMLDVRDRGLPRFDIEYRIRHADGTYRWVNSVGRATEFDPQGRAVRLVGIRGDITERKLAAARLAESEARVARAQKLESIGQLTGGIAHDFNNLLTVIIGNSEDLIEELHDRPQLAQLAGTVKIAGERGAELTSRLLAFARKQALEPKRIQAAAIVHGVLTLLRRTLGAHIEIDVVAEPDTWPVHVDPGQLEQALLNLCINARDAMPGGGRIVIESANVVLSRDDVAAEVGVPAGDYVMVAVADTGSGIPADQLALVFDPFYTTKPAGKGTGLGLSMVYGFTIQSGGAVKIYSEVGAGTVVKLYLPRASGGPASEPSRDSATSAHLARGDELILLVEDDGLVRSHATRLLQSLGYRVLPAANGPEALEIARGERTIDLLFTDVMMPGGMSGPELALQIRKVRPNLRVLFTSGYTDNAIVHFGRVDPGTALLHKPYDRRRLAEKIQQALAGPDPAG
ncbi:MAG: PAS domain-containing protein [Gammaproteobacteria bacterium]|nr:PAS domain-containing protein [Gammaproteobacteria bacterium]